MKQKYILLCSLSCFLLCSIAARGQATIPATGGTARGTEGSVTYTVGQIANSVTTGTNGFIIQGVQQPYEISTVTAIEDTEYITLGYSVYPNPTGGAIKLVISSFNDQNFRFQLYSLNGTILREAKVLDKVTEIPMDIYKSAVYFLRVIRDDREVKVIRIVKR